MRFNPSFFGTRECRKFNYRPRYYDPEKERRKEIFGAVDGSYEKEEHRPGDYIRRNMRSASSRRDLTTGAQRLIGWIGMILFVIVLIYIVKFYAIL